MRNHVTAGNLIVPLLLLAAISLGATGCTPVEAPTTPPIVQLPPTQPAAPEPQSFVLSKAVNWSLPEDVPTGRTPYETVPSRLLGLESSRSILRRCRHCGPESSHPVTSPSSTWWRTSGTRGGFRCTTTTTRVLIPMSSMNWTAA
jgi:hypothetical protein